MVINIVNMVPYLNFIIFWQASFLQDIYTNNNLQLLRYTMQIFYNNCLNV